MRLIYDYMPCGLALVRVCVRVQGGKGGQKYSNFDQVYN